MNHHPSAALLATLVLAAAAPVMAEGMQAKCGAATPSSAHQTPGAEAQRVPDSSPPAAESLQPTRRLPGRDFYRIAFAGGEPAIVGLTWSETNERLELLVYDRRGQLICQGTPSNQQLQCEWAPAQTEDFMVEVRNAEARDVRYRLWTN